MRMRVLCWALALIVPVALMAADANVAMVSGSGTVTVNGSAIRGSSAVYAGDKVAADRNSMLTLTSKTARVTLPEESSIVYGGSKIDMGEGRALINADKGVQAHLANLTITPASGKVRFQLTRTKQAVAVAALNGALNITDGVHSMVLPAGSMMSQEPTPPAPASAKHSGMPGWAVGVIAAGAVGGIVGGLAAAGTFSDSSPVRR